ncbi:hypothetical protein [Spiroplasma endosymbiont of Amphibalanus improvisus]|uniref:hypothetical protein n=1 Tax=Spiroplasma endosymbiont of Amphibalanus improvisus TaxID=3066327 RepID=UPI00313BC02E
MKKWINHKYFFTILINMFMIEFILTILFFILWNNDNYNWSLPLFIIFAIANLTTIIIYGYNKHRGKKAKLNSEELNKLIENINNNESANFIINQISNNFEEYKIFNGNNNDNSLKQTDLVLKGEYQKQEFEIGTYIKSSKQKNEFVKKNIGILENNNNLYRYLILNFKINNKATLTITKKPNDLIDIYKSLNQFYEEEIPLNDHDQKLLYKYIIENKIVPSFKINKQDCAILLDIYNIYSWNDNSETIINLNDDDKKLENNIKKINNYLNIYDELIKELDYLS